MSDPAPSTEQNKVIVRCYVDEVANRRNLATIDELIAADYLHHSYRHATAVVSEKVIIVEK